MKGVLITAVTILSFFCGVARGADKIRVGVPQQVVHWMVFPLAQQKGFFKEEGFDAEIVRITGPSGRSALMSGDIDYYTTIAFIVQSAILGLPVKVVAAYVTCPPFVLMTRPEFKSAQDLKGKTMGIGAPPGSSPDVIGKLSLKHLGVNPDKDVICLLKLSRADISRPRTGTLRCRLDCAALRLSGEKALLQFTGPGRRASHLSRRRLDR